MDYVRIGGVCLLLMILAAALPVNVLAQTPLESANGAAPIISQSQLSEGQTHGETISAETLARRNSGLVPLGTQSSVTAPSGETSGQSQTPVSEAPATTSGIGAVTATPMPSTESPSTEIPTQSSPQASSTQAVTASSNSIPVAEGTVTPDQITQETPDQIAQETATTQTDAGSGQDNEASSATVTPPDDVAPGTVVSGDATVSNDTASESLSENESASQLPEEDDSENATEEQSLEEAPENSEAGTDRIWRQGTSPNSYTWTPQSFSGFFYDLKNDVGTEELTINVPSSGRSIDSGDLMYKTDAQDIDFEFSDWGKYQVIGFMAQKYFAGFRASDVIDRDRSLINDGQLRRVLVDIDSESTITTGSVLPLEEGYELRIKQIDINGNKVLMALARDGEEIDSRVISPDGVGSSTYKYELDISGEKTPIILAHISNVFASTESDLVTVDGLFQISDTYASVESGDKYDRMEVTSVSETGVEMKNEDSFSLRSGSTTRIFGDVGFLVADNTTQLRFAPVVQRTGSYDVRGTVVDPSKTEEFTWNAYNFEGFYYDIDDDVGTESLKARITGNRIEEKDLIYTTSPMRVGFEFERWGDYNVIGFMADKYFAGYSDQTAFTDEASAINEGQLRRVLLDNDDSQTIATGSALSLQEGYELRIKQVDLNGNKVYLALAKDGVEVDSKVVTPSSDAEDRASNYMYKVTMGSVRDVPLITAHVQSVFRSVESDLATVDAIFQISDSSESVEEGEVHGRMKVATLDRDEITMQNDDTITLGQGRVIDIMDNLRIEVADNPKRLLAPIATKMGEGSLLTLSVPGAVVNRPATISVRSGTAALSGVQVSVDGNNIGTTDLAGSISYTPPSTGTFQVVARRTGYNDASANMVVTTAAEAFDLTAIQQANATLANQLAINAPAVVVMGETFLITVVQGINQTPVEGAEILLDGESIGSTSAQGTLTYSANAIGERTLEARKEGLNPATRKITVTSSLRVVNLTVPDTARAQQAVRITAIVENIGSEEDSRMLELEVNGTVVESKNVTVSAGQNSTVNFSYEPQDPGLYRFSVDDQSRTVNVEEAQNNIWLIALILVLLIAIGAGFYLHKTGELNKLQRQVKKMMQGR